MAQFPQSEGAYKATVISATMEAEPGKTPALVVQFAITERWNESAMEWKPTGDMTTKGFFYPVKKDGSANQTCIDQFVNAFEIAGGAADLPRFIRMGEINDKPCQITMKSETYNGKTMLKVGWLRSVNADPRPRAGTLAGDDTWGALAKACGASEVPKGSDPDDALPF